MDSEIVGFIFPGDAVLQAEHPLSLREGLNVIYGLNGAGKTRLLNGLRGALTGVEVSSNVGLILRMKIPDTSEPFPHFAEQEHISTYGRPPALAFAAALASPKDFAVEHGDSLTPADERELSRTAIRELIEQLVLSRLGDVTPTTTEVKADGLSLWVPTGSLNAPSWDAWPVADTRRPEASAMLAHIMVAIDTGINESWEDVEEHVRTLPLFEEGNILWSGAPDTRRLTPAPFMAYEIGYGTGWPVKPVQVTGRVDFGIDAINYEREIDTVTKGVC